MIKPSLLPEAGAETRENQRAVLLFVFETILRISPPFLPFLSEEIWQSLPGERGSILAEAYPSADPDRADVDVEEDMGHLMEVIRAVRNIRSELHVPPAKRVEGRLEGTAED